MLILGDMMSEELNPFKIAQEQLDEAASVMGLDEQAHQILMDKTASVKAARSS